MPYKRLHVGDARTLTVRLITDNQNPKFTSFAIDWRKNNNEIVEPRDCYLEVAPSSSARCAVELDENIRGAHIYVLEEDFENNATLKIFGDEEELWSVAANDMVIWSVRFVKEEDYPV